MTSNRGIEVRKFFALLSEDIKESVDPIIYLIDGF